eukprot:m.268706 g.268706  ORF g.268706 m.268706 type:complete len:581 (+) comp38374_c0_seq1:77-1819(+)
MNFYDIWSTLWLTLKVIAGLFFLYLGWKKIPDYRMQFLMAWTRLVFYPLAKEIWSVFTHYGKTAVASDTSSSVTEHEQQQFLLRRKFMSFQEYQAQGVLYTKFALTELRQRIRASPYAIQQVPITTKREKAAAVVGSKVMQDFVNGKGDVPVHEQQDWQNMTTFDDLLPAKSDDGSNTSKTWTQRLMWRIITCLGYFVVVAGLLCGVRGLLFRDRFGLTADHPLAGPFVVSANVFAVVYSVVGGWRTCAVLLLLGGHTIVHLGVAILAIVKLIVPFCILWAVTVLVVGPSFLGFCALISLFIPFVVTRVHAVMDFIPWAVAYALAYGVTVVDQISKCFVANVLYNRAVWYIGYYVFRGIFDFPLFFCFDGRAFGNHYWAGLPSSCKNPCSHLEALNCLCVSDLDCSTTTNQTTPADGNVAQTCVDYCTSLTSASNVARLPGDEQQCLIVAHVAFVALCFLCFYVLMHRVQRWVIIYTTVCLGYWMLSPFPWPTFLKEWVPAKAFDAWVFGSAFAIQYQVSTRITRILGLDPSLPTNLGDVAVSPLVAMLHIFVKVFMAVITALLLVAAVAAQVEHFPPCQ